MADFTPTAAQSAAIRSRGGAVLVSAGAGSGKTRVLTERLMSYLTDPDAPKDLDSFLIITFTRAAAGELRGRITEELAAALAGDPSNRHLRRQSALCRRAEIGTIHGFCASLLRQNCHALSLSPDFRIIEDERAAAMKSTALEAVMEECYAHSDAHPGFLQLADTVGAGRSDERLCDLVLELHAKMQCHPFPARWAERQIELLRAPVDDAGKTDWGKELLSSALQTAEYWSAELDRVTELMRRSERIAEAYGPSVGTTADALRELCRAIPMGWDRARECLPIPFERLGTLRNTPDAQLSDMVKNRRSDCKKACEKLSALLCDPSEAQLESMRLTHDAMEALLRLTLDFDARYERDKRRGSLVDYSDLEHLSARLLLDDDGSPTELARQVAARYTEIMVDEYQDVSEVQDAIFRAVSRDGKNLFLVGDVKQSIYRFRLARPELFTERYDAYRDWSEAKEGEGRRIALRENFRSRAEVIDAVNAVFSNCMSKQLGDVDYDDAAALRCGASYPGYAPRPEIMLIPAAKTVSGADGGRLRQEADAVAHEILRLVRAETPVSDGKMVRRAEYGDIAILLRTANTVGQIFRAALLRLGIPVAASQGGDFFSSVEVSAVMSMLAVTDNPHRDIALIAALRSPCFSFTADELSAIRAADREGDMYDALCRRAESDARCAAALGRMDALRTIAPDMGCAELVWHIINEFDLLAVCSAMSDGERRRADLMELVELSERFETTGYRGLHRFVLWLRRLAEKGQEGGAAVSGGVRIMTVHRSKGLEFPIVFMCDTAHEFNLRDSSARVLVHPQLGLGAKVTDTARRVEYPSLARRAIKLRLDRETLSEEMRLMYVAMTRAKERLYMTACVSEPEKMIEDARLSVTSPMAPEALSGARTQLSWLISAALADGQEHISLHVAAPLPETESESEPGVAATPDEAFREKLERELAFVYPHRAAETLPSKVTATELKDRAEPDGDAQSVAPKGARRFRTPDFTRAEKPLGGAERGTATHLVLQYMDFSRASDEQGVLFEIERMRKARFLSDREAMAVDAKAIVRLFSSPIGRRMLAAPFMKREFKFSLLCPARELLGADADEQVLLQGVVDCCIEEDGELTVIDYKTDSVRGETQLAERAALYAPQVRAYAAALGRIFSKPVRECVLYFISAGREVHISAE